MSADTFLRAAKGAGLKVVEYPKWKTTSRAGHGAWGPVHGVMHHHTVTRGTESSVSICRKGYADLPGPLCLGVIPKDGSLHMIGWGRTNHAGRGDDDVLRAVIAERTLPPDNEANTDGNVHFYGFESVNLGNGRDPWPRAQLDTMAVVGWIICKYHRWTERSVIAHAEWQPGKIDPAPHPGIINSVRRATGQLLRVGLPDKATPQPLTLEQRMTALEGRVTKLERS